MGILEVHFHDSELSVFGDETNVPDEGLFGGETRSDGGDEPERPPLMGKVGPVLVLGLVLGVAVLIRRLRENSAVA